MTEYAPFELLPEQVREKRTAEKQKREEIRAKLAKHLSDNPHWKKLESDYLDCLYYYLDTKTNTIYEHENVTGVISQPPVDVQEHLVKMNGLY